eukprot:468993-Amphidinium_carterae.1
MAREGLVGSLFAVTELVTEENHDNKQQQQTVTTTVFSLPQRYLVWGDTAHLSKVLTYNLVVMPLCFFALLATVWVNHLTDGVLFNGQLTEPSWNDFAMLWPYFPAA